jgi:hypothetical protein
MMHFKRDESWNAVLLHFALSSTKILIV